MQMSDEQKPVNQDQLIDRIPTKEELLEERELRVPRGGFGLPKGLLVPPLEGSITETDTCWISYSGVRNASMDKKRLQLDFSENAYKELEDLQGRLNATSKSEVIRDALGVLRWLADEVNADHRILVEKPEGTREVVFHFLERSKIAHN